MNTAFVGLECWCHNGSANLKTDFFLLPSFLLKFLDGWTGRYGQTPRRPREGLHLVCKTPPSVTFEHLERYTRCRIWTELEFGLFLSWSYLLLLLFVCTLPEMCGAFDASRKSENTGKENVQNGEQGALSASSSIFLAETGTIILL